MTKCIFNMAIVKHNVVVFLSLFILCCIGYYI